MGWKPKLQQIMSRNIQNYVTQTCLKLYGDTRQGLNQKRVLIKQDRSNFKLYIIPNCFKKVANYKAQCVKLLDSVIL